MQMHLLSFINNWGAGIEPPTFFTFSECDVTAQEYHSFLYQV